MVNAIPSSYSMVTGILRFIIDLSHPVILVDYQLRQVSLWKIIVPDHFGSIIQYNSRNYRPINLCLMAHMGQCVLFEAATIQIQLLHDIANLHDETNHRNNPNMAYSELLAASPLLSRNNSLQQPVVPPHLHPQPQIIDKLSKLLGFSSILTNILLYYINRISYIQICMYVM